YLSMRPFLCSICREAEPRRQWLEDNGAFTACRLPDWAILRLNALLQEPNEVAPEPAAATGPPPYVSLKVVFIEPQAPT
ncbi:MAG TPA: hypothetical protein VHE83_06185, partial [Mycobacteriales bacterium]|nr:hypothetical protein [Mycobacteriales bacterium]